MSKIPVENRKYDADICSAPDFEFLMNPVLARRVVGAPSGFTRQLSDLAAASSVTELGIVEEEINSALDEVVCILERSLPLHDDDKLRNKTLNMKRDLFNKRFGRQYDFGYLKGIVSEEEHSKIVKLLTLIGRKQDIEKGFVNVYERDLDYGRHNLRKLFENYNIRNGLIYSNPQLYKELFQLYNDGKSIKGKKKRNLEHKLCLYLNRASTKTSPMTTFTTVQTGKWLETGRNGQGNGEGYSGGYKVKHKIKFSSAVAQHMAEEVLKDFSSIAPSFNLKLNEAMQIDGDKVRIVQTLSRVKMNPNMYGNVKCEAKTQLNPLLKAVIDIFKSSQGAELSAESICNEFVERLGEKARVPTMTALQHLFKHQIIIPDYVWYEQEDALEQVISLLEKVNSRKAIDLRNVFLQMQDLLGQYLTHDLSERYDIRGKIVDLTERAAVISESSLSAKEIDPPFYEDAILDDGQHSDWSTDVIADFKDDLHAWLEISPVLSANMAIQSALASLFKQEFGEDGICSSPQEFLESADKKLTSGEGEVNGFLGPYSVPTLLAQQPELKKLSMIRQQLVDGIMKKLGDNKEVFLDKEWIKQLADEVPDTIARRTISHAYFGQIIKETGKADRFVLNQTLVGYGILFSRFLDKEDESKVSCMKEYVARLSGDKTLVELPGVYGFNANYHPRFLDHELAINTHKSNYADTRKISLDKCDLVYDKKTDRVYLRDREIGLIEPIFMGFLTPIYLPEITRLLSLSYSHGIVVFILAQMIQSGWLDLDSEKYIPRVNLGNLVLWRRTWVYPKRNLPDYDLPEHEFFKQLLLWKQERGLADEMFVRFAPVVSRSMEKDTNPNDQDKIDWSNVDFTAMKPSYINFRNPTLVQSFQKLLKRFSRLVIFQETLPELGKSSCELDGESYVNELQIEVSRIAQ